MSNAVSPTLRPPADTVAPDIPAATRPRAGLASSTLVVAKRSLIHFMRTPQLLVVATVQGAMFLLIFRYVFGGAITGPPGVSYVDFLVPGYVVTGVLFSGMGAASGVAEDLQQGVVDRLRSLPIPRFAVAGGRALAETVLVVWGAAVTTAIGFAVGFRPEGSVAGALFAFLLVVIFGFSFTWMFMLIGLVAGSAQAAQGLSLLVFPLTFVSSAYVPVDTMPAWMQPIARNQPISVMVDAVRSWVVADPMTSLGHSTWYFTIRALAWSAVLLLAFAPLAVARYR
jgi:ABC-2 type transport system permease protein